MPRRPRRARRTLAALSVASGVAAVPSVAGERSPTPATESRILDTELRVNGVHVHVALEADTYLTGAGELIEWVRRSASIVAGYYGVFPVATLDVSVLGVDGAGVRRGQAFADPRPRIRVEVGRAVSKAALLDDWVLVHEMTHLALPEVGVAHAWLAEGLATYVEGIARVQAGNLGARELWQQDVAAMPKGMPGAGDQGLDHTHTWGRTYWGGALFCLAADVAIRERSGNRRGLQDALRAVMRESGGMAASWPVERVFSVGDAATGTTVLGEIYQSMRDSPSAPDLSDLWGRLGVQVQDGVVRLDTGTREAEIRDAITRRPAA